MPWFQRPHPVFNRYVNGADQQDGWYFIAFKEFWRVRGWRIYRWGYRQ